MTAEGNRAISSSYDTTARVWDLSPNLSHSTLGDLNIRYTNAKVLLVGETGVGKTGLAIRLTEDRFEPTTSTKGAWATQMKLAHQAGKGDIDREIWLWDFAGQADYRLIHQLFLDETALAVLVFNPQKEDLFLGLGQWDRDLQRAARQPWLRKLLVAGRCDCGALIVSRDSIEQFRSERGFSDYLETSALTGAVISDN
jgi:GTPase SAR1 family protein